MNINLIVLSAGRGTRIGGNKPLVKVLDRPLVAAAVEAVIQNERHEINEKIIVVNENGAAIRQLLGDGYFYPCQEIADGTGGALMAASAYLTPGEASLVINCDLPLMRHSTVAAIIDRFKAIRPAALLVTATVDNPHGYGRIVRRRGKIMKIIEERDLKRRQKKIKEVNAGIYLFQNDYLLKLLPRLTPNAKGEKYLTDLIALLVKEKNQVSYYPLEDAEEMYGVNDLAQLIVANEVARKRKIEDLVKNRVNIPFPGSVIIGEYAKIAGGVTIEPGTTILGHSEIASGVVVAASRLEAVKVGPDSHIHTSVLSDSIIGARCQIGPFTHLRQKTIIDDDCRVGNFVEMKATKFGTHSKSAHLSYLGDAEVGSDVNIGCGVITANYNGHRKQRTVIESGAFIGCNSSLLAPLTIGKQAFIAAGSTINRDVPSKALAIARARQEVKENYQFKEK